MMRLSLVVGLAAICHPNLVSAQTSNRSAPVDGEKSVKAAGNKSEKRDEDRALVLKRRLAQERLEAIGRRAQTLDASILKVKILTKAGDGLWKHDESEARQLLLVAFQTVDSIKLNPKEDQRAALAEKHTGTTDPLFHLRSYVLQLIARHDSRLAEKLRKSLEKNSNDPNKKPDATNQEEQKHLSLNIALALAATQPERSAAIVRQLLKDGLDDSLILTLVAMRPVNQKLADQLFGVAMQTAQQHGMGPNEFLTLSIYVLPTEQDSFLRNDPFAEPTRALVTRAFLDYLHEGSSQTFAPDNFVTKGNEIDHGLAARSYYALQKLIPVFERLQPQRAAYIREQSRSLLGLMSPRETTKAEKAPQLSSDELLRQAESTVGEKRRTLRFMRASAAALSEGDIDKAVAIAERIDDLRERKIQTSLILYQAASRQLREANIERAVQYAKRIEFIPQRVSIDRKIAQKLWEGKQPERALAILEDLCESLGKADNTASKADAMFAVTATMVEYDRGRGFAFLEGAISALNKTDFSFRPPPSDQISVELQVAPDMLDLETPFSVLAQEDFERTYALAGLLTRTELSLLAQAQVCQQMLAGR